MPFAGEHNEDKLKCLEYVMRGFQEAEVILTEMWLKKEQAREAVDRILDVKRGNVDLDVDNPMDLLNKTIPAPVLLTMTAKQQQALMEEMQGLTPRKQDSLREEICRTYICLLSEDDIPVVPRTPPRVRGEMAPRKVLKEAPPIRSPNVTPDFNESVDLYEEIVPQQDVLVNKGTNMQ